MKNNPYITIIKTDPDILQESMQMESYKWKWNEYLQRNAPIHLEIGTGLWHFFSLESSQNKDKNFIWMEIKYKRLYKTAEKSRNLWTTHFVLLKEFWQKIDFLFAPEEITRTYIFFPDPWDNKDRQKKHKLLQKEFLEKLYVITKTWGEFFFKTDHSWYFEDVVSIIRELWLWEIRFISNDYEKESEVFEKRKITEFESMYRGKKLSIHYAEFVKK